MLEINLGNRDRNGKAPERKFSCPFCKGRNTMRISLNNVIHHRCVDSAPWSVEDPSRGLWQTRRKARGYEIVQAKLPQ